MSVGLQQKENEEKKGGGEMNKTLLFVLLVCSICFGECVHQWTSEVFFGVIPTKFTKEYITSEALIGKTAQVSLDPVYRYCKNCGKIQSNIGRIYFEKAQWVDGVLAWNVWKGEVFTPPYIYGTKFNDDTMMCTGIMAYRRKEYK